MDPIAIPSQISWEISSKKKGRLVNAYRAPWWRQAYWYFRLWQSNRAKRSK